MSILINQNTKVLVQGITGRSGLLQTKVMKEYGTNIVAGTTPGKGGTVAEGVPVYDTVKEAVEAHEINAAISFVPPAFLRESCFEIIDSGIPFLVVTTEGIPEHDVTDIMYYASIKGTKILGPGCSGLIAPGECKLGSHPGWMYQPGSVGVVSKSGALSYEIGKTLTAAGIGQSTVVGIGGGPVWGLTTKDIVALYNDDPKTEIIVLLGEIGGSLEEEAAAYIAANVKKPVIALIVGRAAPEGKSLGHAGAIIDGEKGTADYKIKKLSEAGVKIARTPAQIVRYIQEMKG